MFNELFYDLDLSLRNVIGAVSVLAMVIITILMLLWSRILLSRVYHNTVRTISLTLAIMWMPVGIVLFIQSLLI
jgi:hypothetical protein